MGIFTLKSAKVMKIGDLQHSCPENGTHTHAHTHTHTHTHTHVNINQIKPKKMRKYVGMKIVNH